MTNIAASSGLTRPQDTGMQLRRVDTNAWEAPQTGVVYYAPFQHGEFFDDTSDTTVYREYFSGNTGSATVALDGSFGYNAVISCGGVVLDSSKNTSCPVGVYLDATMYAAITNEAGSLNLDVGSDLDDASDLYYLWVDYIGVIPPA